ncbi:hypothetical protein CHS0354_008907 [Potamilus streckersoni]|uniref:Uncharacterized protein n=1 Tax=Potamilus streckersoni TaxID=2493646 RepID=A0AAE0SYN7_9BIVA|nr:hypothetical protein CHS0354_008907 [Potamilus streckersoni]
MARNPTSSTAMQETISTVHEIQTEDPEFYTNPDCVYESCYEQVVKDEIREVEEKGEQGRQPLLDVELQKELEGTQTKITPYQF